MNWAVWLLLVVYWVAVIRLTGPCIRSVLDLRRALAAQTPPDSTTPEPTETEALKKQAGYDAAMYNAEGCVAMIFVTPVTIGVFIALPYLAGLLRGSSGEMFVLPWAGTVLVSLLPGVALAATVAHDASRKRRGVARHHRLLREMYSVGSRRSVASVLPAIVVVLGGALLVLGLPILGCFTQVQETRIRWSPAFGPRIQEAEAESIQEVVYTSRMVNARKYKGIRSTYGLRLDDGELVRFGWMSSFHKERFQESLKDFAERNGLPVREIKGW